MHSNDNIPPGPIISSCLLLYFFNREHPIMWGVEVSSGHGPREVKTSLQLSDRPLVDHIIFDTGNIFYALKITYARKMKKNSWISKTVLFFRLPKWNGEWRQRGPCLLFHHGVLQSCQLCMNEHSARLWHYEVVYCQYLSWAIQMLINGERRSRMILCCIKKHAHRALEFPVNILYNIKCIE